MVKLLIGIVITTVVLYMWGGFYWGGGTPYHQVIWRKPVDEDMARKALREQFPENRTYFIPGVAEDQDKVNANFREGPVAFVHMMNHDGRDPFGVNLMINGFILNTICVTFLVFLLRWLSPALPTYRSRVLFCAAIGLLIALFSDAGTNVWWGVDWQWEVYNGFYSFTAFLISGIVLGAFVSAPKQAESTE